MEALKGVGWELDCPPAVHLTVTVPASELGKKTISQRYYIEKEPCDREEMYDGFMLGAIARGGTRAPYPPYLATCGFLYIAKIRHHSQSIPYFTRQKSTNNISSTRAGIVRVFSSAILNKKSRINKLITMTKPNV